MKITGVEPFILHIPVKGDRISDSTHAISHWGVVGAKVKTSSGITGWGFTGTHAFLPGDQLVASCIKECYGPVIKNECALDVNGLWKKMSKFPPMQWIGRSGITQLALAAIDIALWDINAKNAEMPLWKLLGGALEDKLPAYNTDVGWLSIPDELLVDGVKRTIEEDGFNGIKLKVGSDNIYKDLIRLEKVRNVIDDNVMLAVDGNGKWDLSTCIEFCKEAEQFDLFWFEEPLWYDDIKSHSELRTHTTIPIALGEQLYNHAAFQTFFNAKAIHYVQPDITRLGGITEFLTIADEAYERRLPVAPHIGDMGQAHVHLAFYHPACTLLEYIPWIKDAFEEPISVKEGNYLKPVNPGAGTTLTSDAISRFAKSLN